MVLSVNRIYNADCLEFMEHAPDSLFDVIVTSPPYNIGKNYGPYIDSRRKEEYLEWLGSVAKRSKRILKGNGSFFLNMGAKPSDPMVPFEAAARFAETYSLQNVIHWIKHISIPNQHSEPGGGARGYTSHGHFKPVNSEFYLSQAHEYVFHFTGEGRTRIDKMAIGVPYQDKSNVKRWSRKSDLRDRGNVWFVPYQTSVGKYLNPKLHPAEFPPELPALCIKLHGVRPDMLVYDPFMGIGSTALACSELGVQYVGTEVNPQYIQIAMKRLEEHGVFPGKDGIRDGEHDSGSNE
ncbi:MAG: site-specific DNA-methyltransferase [Candidatus Thermoplasmatota archaeon]|jgi:site-specific DNA-methyltransferase (adenine-specific)|nr:site-specific DNA-methyltransferase [Candidatus Thermoplasmatota archaeon]MCL5794106.1 site-specific DNA-methyltransferase [Candidatus Thermoplasmatota archaeon]